MYQQNASSFHVAGVPQTRLQRMLPQPAGAICNLVLNGLVLMMLTIGLSACGTDEPGLDETERGALEVGQVAVQTAEDRAVDPAGRTVVLEGLRGTLDVRGQTDSQAAWTFTKVARGRDSTRAQNVLEGIGIAERGSEQRYTFELRSDVPERSTVNVAGTLPVGTPLTVRRSSGAVHLRGLRSAVDVEQTHGDVHVEAAEGPVQVRLDNGDITVDWAMLPANVEADLETENGTIRITLPDTASVQLDVATTAGRVFSQGLDYMNRELQGSEAGYQFAGQLGTGEAQVRARTTHGNIVLAARPESPAPSDTTSTSDRGANAETSGTGTVDADTADVDTTGEGTDMAPEDVATPDTLIEAPQTAPSTDTTRTAPPADSTNLR